MEEDNMSQTISCPNCNEKIDVTDLLLSEVTKESEERHKAEMAKVEQKAEADFERRKAEFVKKHSDTNDTKLAEEKKKLKDNLENASAATLDVLREELESQTKTIKELSVAAAQLENIKRKSKLDIATATSETEARVYKQAAQESQDAIDQITSKADLKGILLGKKNN